jgi:hypothetical protein
VRAHRRRLREHDEREQERGHAPAAGIPTVALEAEHEREQIEHERDDPEQRNDRDLLAELIGHGEQESRGARRQCEPEPPLAGGRKDFRSRAGRSEFDGTLADANDANDAERAHHRERDERRGPAGRLRPRREPRLDDEGIREQREQRAGVGERVEAIGRRGAGFARCPRLLQRRARGEGKEGQRHRSREHEEHVEHGIHGAVGPRGRGGRDRQERERTRGEREQQRSLHPQGQRADRRVRERVAREQQRLEEEHARGPDRRRSAEPRQDRPSDDRLHLEEEERAQEDGRGAKHQLAFSTGRASAMVGRTIRAASGGRDAG